MGKFDLRVGFRFYTRAGYKTETLQSAVSQAPTGGGRLSCSEDFRDEVALMIFRDEVALNICFKSARSYWCIVIDIAENEPAKHLQTLLIKFLLELVPRNAEPCAERRSRQSARFCCEVVRPVRRSEEGLPLLPLLPRGQVPRLSLDRPLLRPCALRVLRQAPCDVVPRRGAQSVHGVSSGSAPAACSAVHAQLAD